MKRNRTLMIFLSLALLASLTMSCGLVNTAVNKAIGGDSNMSAVSKLWDDVPAMDGMNAAQKIEMPIWLKALTGPILDGMMKGLNEGQSAGHWDWVAFTLKGKTPADVENFYTQERIIAAGWQQAEGGCMSLADQGTLCSYSRDEKGKSTGLVIIATADDQKQEMTVFFLRAEGVPTGSG